MNLLEEEHGWETINIELVDQVWVIASNNLSYEDRWVILFHYFASCLELWQQSFAVAAI